ncbi:hypothetical protein N7493_011093 [Penicillium malachiteum]|uniref:Tyrosine specific protein phosphatases domain-containing protein n=1 Tax=Penicillium malachiteum TaxID=1324776 RepID=A0AAD6MQY5_9EURO|nr:hypothetical protein N7493_011093 [Penicillium malachiteum]
MDLENEGMVNFREFGGYHSTLRSNTSTRHGFLYRSGHLSNLTPAGWQMLRDLKISTVFRLTTEEEAKSLYPKDYELPKGIEGFEFVELPLQKDSFSREEILRRYTDQVAKGSVAVAEGYMDLLRGGAGVIAEIFLHIKAHPTGVFLIHCSMGKDRTGVIFALILSLAGVPREVIAAEYSLSESALKQYLPLISQLAQVTMPEGADKRHVDIMAEQVIKSSADFMLLTLQTIDDQFGGVTGYLKSQCGLSEEDICQVQNLLLERSVRSIP